MHYNLVYSYQIFDVIAAKPLRMVLGALIIQTKFQFAAPSLWNRSRKKCVNRKPNQLQKRKQVQRNVKDRLFRYLFEKDREALMDLYNALNGTHTKIRQSLRL